MGDQLTDAQFAWVAKFTGIDPKPAAAPPSQAGSDTTPGDPGAAAPVRAKFSPPPQSRQPTLRQGDQSPDGSVEDLQELLDIQVTGTFDAKTYAKVQAFQGSHGCQVDGVVGNETWSMLRHEKHEAVGTDGREPHSFEQHGVQARFYLEDKYVIYNKSNDWSRSRSSWWATTPTSRKTRPPSASLRPEAMPARSRSW